MTSIDATSLAPGHPEAGETPSGDAPRYAAAWG